MAKTNPSAKSGFHNKMHIRKSSGTAERPRPTVFASEPHLRPTHQRQVVHHRVAFDHGWRWNQSKGSQGQHGGATAGYAHRPKGTEGRRRNSLFDRNGYLYHGRVQRWPMPLVKLASLRSSSC